MKNDFLQGLLDILNNKIIAYEFLANRARDKEDKASIEGKLMEVKSIQEIVWAEIYGKKGRRK